MIVRPANEDKLSSIQLANQKDKKIVQQEKQARKPANYLAKAIVFTVLFCFPFGIPAIVNAAKVDRLWKRGRYDQAKEKSKIVNRWCRTALIVGICFWALLLLYIKALMADWLASTM